MTAYVKYFYIFAVLPAFILASATDMKKREIPLWLFPSVFILYIILFHDIVWSDNWIGMGIMGAAFMIMALAGKMGGGDVIMFAAAGFIIGMNRLLPYMVILTGSSTLIILLHVIHKRSHNKKDEKSNNEEKTALSTSEIPIAPMAGIAFAIWVIFF